MKNRSLATGILCFLCVLCFLCLPVNAQQVDPRTAELRGKLQRDLEKTTADFDGVMGIAVKDLTSGETFFVNADTVFPQASSIKIPILLELLRQAQAGPEASGLKLDERVELKRALMTGGSGVLLRFGDGTSALSLRDLATLMIVLSDNTATNILIDRVGMDNVNGLLRELGLKETKLQRRMMDVEAGRASRENDRAHHVTDLAYYRVAAVLDWRSFTREHLRDAHVVTRHVRCSGDRRLARDSGSV